MPLGGLVDAVMRECFRAMFGSYWVAARRLVWLADGAGRREG